MLADIDFNGGINAEGSGDEVLAGRPFRFGASVNASVDELLQERVVGRELFELSISDPVET